MYRPVGAGVKHVFDIHLAADNAIARYATKNARSAAATEDPGAAAAMSLFAVFRAHTSCLQRVEMVTFRDA